MDDVVEDYRNVDVLHWHRKGLLRPGNWFGWSWYEGERHEASIGVAVTGDGVRLSYVWGRGMASERELNYTVGLARTACHFGGTRPWFVCPGRGCGRRVTRLYLRGAYFLCRHCQGLGYREGRPYRLLRRARRIRECLGGPCGLSYPFPARPKGMWRRTYAQLRREAEAAEREGYEGTDGIMARVVRGLAEALGVKEG